MTLPVVSVLTADFSPQLELENAELHCRVEELVAEVEHWKAVAHAARLEVADANRALKQEREKGRRW